MNHDAVVVGSGPNGLSAAIYLAQAGHSVLVIEGKDHIGGGVRSAEITLPGFVHDVCSAIFPLSLASPFLRTLPLQKYGLEWVYPPVELAHPLDNGRAVLVQRSIEATAQALGEDADAYRVLMRSVVDDWRDLVEDLLGPAPLPPKHPLALTGFGLLAIRPASNLAKSYFKSEEGRALFAGMAGHAIQRLESLGTGAYGILLGMLAHAVGWPLARGGSQKVVNAMAAYLRELGGEITTGSMVNSIDELPPAQAYLLDLTPKGILKIIGDRLPSMYRRQLEGFRYGPGVCKVDWALDGQIPWTSSDVARAGTVHLGGTLEEIAAAERVVWRGDHPDKPYVLLAQQSLFDPSRAPDGKQTAWAYCHVPNGSNRDVSSQIEAQVERFAPGFREQILARHVHTADQMEVYNPNYVGGDINGGIQDLRQLYTRPVPRLNPYSTPLKGVYICSSSTPPGGGVHGMCGYHAARAALKDLAQEN
jgi:phytoene dehydrogenase-like protein